MEQANAAEGHLNDLDGIDCPICRNKGYVLIDPNTQRPCECMRQRENMRRIRRSGLKSLDRYTFQSFQAVENWQKDLLESAMSYARDHRERWFFVGGQSGAGKTHICTAICGELIRKERILYICWRDEAVALKPAAVHDPDFYAARVRDIKNFPVLYIDDFFKVGGGGNPTEGDANLAFEILNFRYAMRLPTIISSEMTLGQIGHVDEAIAGRIRERAGEWFRHSIHSDPSKNWRRKERTIG